MSCVQLWVKAMAFTIEINASQKTVFSTFEGEVDGEDLRSARAELANRPDFDPSFHHVIDFYRITKVNVSVEFLRDYAYEKSVFHRAARQIVVAPQPHVYGLARMTQILMQSQTPNIEVVRSLGEARAALGISNPGSPKHSRPV